MADRLTVWCLGSFNVAALTVGGVLSLHAFADLGDPLAGLDTRTGLALFLALWAITLWTNDRALAGVWERGEGPGLRTLVGRALAWGAATGVCFLWVIVALVYLPEGPGPGSLLDAVLGAAGVVLLVSAFAAIVGALIGVVVGSLDLLVLGTARSVVGEPPGDGEAIILLERTNVRSPMSSERPTRTDLRPGMTVEIDQNKNSNENANPIRGDILKVLSEEHTEPGGIKVKLESGAVGRVRRIVVDE